MGHVKHVQNILGCLYCCWPAPVMPFHKELRCPHIFPHRSWWATINSSLSHLQLQRQVSQHLNQSVPSFVYIFPTFGIYFQSKPPSHGPALRTAAISWMLLPHLRVLRVPHLHWQRLDVFRDQSSSTLGSLTRDLWI